MPPGTLRTKTNRSVSITPQCEYHPIVGGQYAGVEGTNVTISIGGGNVTIDWMRVGSALPPSYKHGLICEFRLTQDWAAAATLVEVSLMFGARGDI